MVTYIFIFIFLYIYNEIVQKLDHSALLARVYGASSYNYVFSPNFIAMELKFG